MSHQESKNLSRRSGWKRAILHVDMDAFYVNVHILDHPEDAGIPLAVGGKPNERGVVASASYEARAKGVRSAMPMRRAVALCPEMKIVPWPPRISECSKQVMEILREYGPMEQVSVDEAYIDLGEQLAPVRISDEIRKRVLAETKLPASVGLATCKLVAKVASDKEKPKGFTVVVPGTEAKFLAPLSVRAIWGIGPRTAERMAALGITTCGQLAAADPIKIRQTFGNQAHSLQQRARGIDTRQVVTERGLSKSISSEWTFNEDVNNADFLQEKLQQMTASVGKSLRRQGVAAHTVTVKFRLADFTTYTRQKSVNAGISTDEDILTLATAIWRKHWQPGTKLRLLGVGVSNIGQPQVRQLTFEF